MSGAALAERLPGNFETCLFLTLTIGDVCLPSGRRVTDVRRGYGTFRHPSFAFREGPASPGPPMKRK